MDSQKKNTLLIVDDDKSNLMVLSHILETEYSIRVASDGTSAVTIAKKYAPDLILLDILMPDMDGYQVFAALHNFERTARIPVIFITGLNNNDDEKKGLKLGAVDYISKPFDETIVKLRVYHQIQIINQLRTIERLSMIDQLTGLPNRRSFDARLQSDWGRSIRETVPLSMLLIDVDHFKEYNDTYGHQQGDKALCTIAEIVPKTLKRTSDFTARWGGEEFAVLLPNVNSKGGMTIGEQVRKNIEAADIPCNDGAITKLTISIGVNTQVPTLAYPIHDFILKTDKALYKAKGMGRNRVCLYE